MPSQLEIHKLTQGTQLSTNYRITNQSDIEILQENYPQDFVDIYNDEKDTWLLTNLSTKHIQTLQEYYNPLQIYYLNLYYQLLTYKQYYEDNFSYHQMVKLNISLNNMEYKIKEVLSYKEDYDESNTDINDVIWKRSDNYNVNKENNPMYIYQYNINLLLFKNILTISDTWSLPSLSRSTRSSMTTYCGMLFWPREHRSVMTMYILYLPSINVLCRARGC